MKKLFAIALAFFAFSAMATGTYYQSPGGGVYFNNSNPAYGNPQPVQRAVPVYPAYQQNNQTYQQYRPLYNTNQQQYHTSPQYPRESYERRPDNHEFQNCIRRWERSGYHARYDRRTGCMVEVNGYLIPERNVQVKVHR